MLFYQGSLIQLHIPLQDYGLKDGECVSLVVKGVGGGGDVVVEMVHLGTLIVYLKLIFN